MRKESRRLHTPTRRQGRETDGQDHALLELFEKLDAGVEAALSGGLSEASIAAAAAQVADGQAVLADHFAGEAYRRHLAKVFARKALAAIA